MMILSLICVSINAHRDVEKHVCIHHGVAVLSYTWMSQLFATSIIYKDDKIEFPCNLTAGPVVAAAIQICIPNSALSKYAYTSTLTSWFEL